MMQRRLILSLGLSFCLLWVAVAALIYVDLKAQVSQTLDQRLAATATLVAGLVARQPELLSASLAQPLLVEPESEGVACQIRARDGNVVLRTHGSDATLFSGAEPGFVDREVVGQRWRLYTLEQDGLLITTADRLAERTALQNGIIMVMVLPFMLALSGSLLVLWWGIRRGLAPLQRLYLALSRRSPSSLAPVSIGPLPDELRPVVSTLNDLLLRVRTVVLREQRFAGQAAHELRTPLTAVKTHLQVAMRQAPGASSRALQQAEAGLARLQRVIEQLLLLARLDQPEQWGAPRASVEAVIAEALAELPGRDRMSVTDPYPYYLMALPTTLAAMALRNLADNALRHSRPGSPVMLSVRCAADGVSFVVEDEGKNKGKGDIPASGQPVSTAGHRLGLTIVNAIAEHFGGEFTLRGRASGGMHACLRLPLAPLHDVWHDRAD